MSISRAHHSLACLTLVTVLRAGPAAAQGLDEQPASASYLGLAGAPVVGLAEPAALWINPAELAAQAGRLGLALGAGVVASHRALALGGVDAESPTRDVGPPVAAPAITVAGALLQGRLYLAAGYRQQRHLRSHYLRPPRIAVPGPGNDAPVEDSARYLAGAMTLVDHRLGLGLAFGPVRWLRFGATAEVALITLTHRRTLWAGFAEDAAPLSGDPAESSRHDVEAALDLDGLGYGLRLGLAVKPWRWLELGATLRFTSRIDLSGPLSLAPACDPSRADCTPARYDLGTRGGAAELELALPLELAVGLALRPVSWLRVLLAGRLSRWSSADEPVADVNGAWLEVDKANIARNEGTYPLGSLPLGIGLRDALGLHAGVEVLLQRDLDLRLRLGWAWQRGATADKLPSPTILDLDRHLIAGGAQATVGGVTIALGIGHSLATTLTTRAERATLLNPLAEEGATPQPVGAGDYEAQGTRVMLEIRYTLGERR